MHRVMNCPSIVHSAFRASVFLKDHSPRKDFWCLFISITWCKLERANYNYKGNLQDEITWYLTQKSFIESYWSISQTNLVNFNHFFYYLSQDGSLNVQLFQERLCLKNINLKLWACKTCITRSWVFDGPITLRINLFDTKCVLFIMNSSVLAKQKFLNSDILSSPQRMIIKQNIKQY